MREIRERIPLKLLRENGSECELTGRRFMGVLRHPVPRREMLRQCGVDSRGSRIVVDWPGALTDGVPIQAGDIIECEGRRHVVQGVKACPVIDMELYLVD